MTTRMLTDGGRTDTDRQPASATCDPRPVSCPSRRCRPSHRTPMPQRGPLTAPTGTTSPKSSAAVFSKLDDLTWLPVPAPQADSPAVRAAPGGQPRSGKRIRLPVVEGRTPRSSPQL